jgi:hypothetical protein
MELGFVGRESGFVGMNQVSLEEIRYPWKKSSFLGCVVNMA